MALTLDEICQQVLSLTPAEQDIVADFIAQHRYPIHPDDKAEMLKVARERSVGLATGKYKTRDAFEALAEFETRHQARKPRP